VKALVVYDTVFGNTKQVALAIASAFGDNPDALAVSVTEADSTCLDDIDLLVVGSPTRGFKPTEAIARFLRDLPERCLEGTTAAAFDTRISAEDIRAGVLRFIVKSGGYAAPHISRGLSDRGARVIAAPEGFIVTASGGPLRSGECDRAADWARGLTDKVTS